MSKPIFSRDDLKSIIKRKANKEKLDEAEQAAFEDWINADPRNEETFNSLTNDSQRYRNLTDSDSSEQSVKEYVAAVLKNMIPGFQAITWSLWRTIGWVAAAAVVIGIGIYTYVSKSGRNDNTIAQTHNAATDRAVLTLSNGTSIQLNGTDTVHLADQGQAAVQQVGGQLKYENVRSTTEIVYNELSTPRAGKYIILLADSSKLFVNAASRVRIPSSFTGGTRTIELLDGEIYLEVAKNAHAPFIVLAPSNGEVMAIKVLGTHFNVKAYPNEQVRTTLLEGKVEVSKGDERVILQPGQQVAADRSRGGISPISQVLTDTVVDWKDNRFIFHSDKVIDLVRKISLWYDVEIQIVDDPSVDYANLRSGATGTIPRTLPLEKVLAALKNAGVPIDFKDNKVIVYQ